MASEANPTSNTGLVALTAGGPHAWIMINALRDVYGDFLVIQEDGESSKTFWRRRKKLIGASKVLSMQAARIPMRVTKIGTQKRIKQLIREHGLRPTPDAETPITRVSSVNSNDARDAIAAESPSTVFVVSTRMLSRQTLESVDAPFINYHSGINPAYRGMFGGYFALANGEPEHFGTTMHLIDSGVDTGEILYQAHQKPDKADNFHTYIWTMAAESRDIVKRAVADGLSGQLNPIAVDLPSKQYFAPTFFGYLWTGLTKGVW